MRTPKAEKFDPKSKAGKWWKFVVVAILVLWPASLVFNVPWVWRLLIAVAVLWLVDNVHRDRST